MTPPPPDGKLLLQEILAFAEVSGLMRGAAVRMRDRYLTDGYDKLAAEQQRVIERYDKALTALRKKVQAVMADDL